ncbi:MAG: DPP IV N-terminal domain-containing protein, partial [Phycisphaerae bacterium]
QKPGDRVTVSRPHLFHVTPPKEIPLSTHLASNPWSITEIRWNPDSGSFTYLYNQRGHQIMRVLRVDAHSGHIHPVVEEICHDDRSPKFFDYSGKQFTFYLPKFNEMIWMSERDGWNHLYLFDLTTGRLKNRITSGPWVVRSVLWVDPAKRQIWLRVGGIYPSQDPYFVHYCRVNFDGTQLTRLTDADGTHKAVMSPDRRFLVAVWSRVDSPPVTE